MNNRKRVCTDLVNLLPQPPAVLQLANVYEFSLQLLEFLDQIDDVQPDYSFFHVITNVLTYASVGDQTAIMAVILSSFIDALLGSPFSPWAYMLREVHESMPNARIKAVVDRVERALLSVESGNIPRPKRVKLGKNCDDVIVTTHISMTKIAREFVAERSNRSKRISAVIGSLKNIDNIIAAQRKKRLARNEKIMKERCRSFATRVRVYWKLCSEIASRRLRIFVKEVEEDERQKKQRQWIRKASAYTENLWERIDLRSRITDNEEAEAEMLALDLSDDDGDISKLREDADMDINELVAQFGLPSSTPLADPSPSTPMNTTVRRRGKTRRRSTKARARAISKLSDSIGKEESKTSDVGIDLLEVTQREVSPFLKIPLRIYQLEGFSWLKKLHGHGVSAILADEMGLGKTIQAISLLAHLATEKGIWGPHLVIAPASVIYNWEREFLKCAPAFNVMVYDGTKAAREAKRKGMYKKFALNVIITSYNIALSDSVHLRRLTYYYMILDEAHVLKNFTSCRWSAVASYACVNRLLLTGTPLQNNLLELWSLMYLIVPEVFNSHEDFNNIFNNPLLKAIATNTANDSVAEIIQQLYAILQPFLLRRLKRNVEKELPRKTEHVIRCTLTRKQRKIYHDLIEAYDENRKGQLSYMMLIMDLRKACNHPSLAEAEAIESSIDAPQFQVSGDYPSFLRMHRLQEPTICACDGFPSGGSYDIGANMQTTLPRLHFGLQPEQDIFSRLVIRSKHGVDTPVIDMMSESARRAKMPIESVTKPVSSQQATISAPNMHEANVDPDGKTPCILRYNEIRDASFTPDSIKAPPETEAEDGDANRTSPGTVMMKQCDQSTKEEHSQSPAAPHDRIYLEFTDESIGHLKKLDRLDSLDLNSRNPLSKSNLSVYQLASADTVLQELRRQDNESARARLLSRRITLADASFTSYASRAGTPNFAQGADYIRKLLCEPRLPVTEVGNYSLNRYLGRNWSTQFISRNLTQAYESIADKKFHMLPLHKFSFNAPRISVHSCETSSMKHTRARELSSYQNHWYHWKPPLVVQNISSYPATNMIAFSMMPVVHDSIGNMPRLRPNPCEFDNIISLCGHGGYLAHVPPTIGSYLQACASVSTRVFNQSSSELDKTTERLLKTIKLDNVIPPKNYFLTLQFGFLSESQPIKTRTGRHVRKSGSCRQSKQKPKRLKPYPTIGIDFNEYLQMRSVPIACIPRAEKRRDLITKNPADIQFESGKLQKLKGLLRNARDEGRKVIIFTQMTRMLNILEQFLSIHGVKYLRLDGSTKIERRQQLIDQFNSDGLIQVFMTSARAGGVGINLTAASIIIFYDTDWNPAMDKQAMDRCHRLGQTRDVDIYRLISEYSIEENIWRKQLEKRKLDELFIDHREYQTAKAIFAPDQMASILFTINHKDDLYASRELHGNSEESLVKPTLSVESELQMAVEDDEDVKLLHEVEPPMEEELLELQTIVDSQTPGIPASSQSSSDLGENLLQVNSEHSTSKSAVQLTDLKLAPTTSISVTQLVAYGVEFLETTSWTKQMDSVIRSASLSKSN